ncbi:SDR family oxidoreductase [Tardiphaga sp.]|uniref:SDR family oxidoreductase n=1 Tax=Tardiphaga sp. TaxID=1926292 RepID=UPI00352A10B8
MSPRYQKILVLGGSGLIGRYVAEDLRLRGFTVTTVARHYAASQKTSADDLEMPIMATTADDLTRLMVERKSEMVVNCLGVLQDGAGTDTTAVHRDFTAKLLAAIKATTQPVQLVHISIPGAAGSDDTAFSKTKRDAERLIADAGLGSTILRPGFVIAPAAYGGSALVRALAATPFADLPSDLACRQFQPVAVDDVASTIAWLCEHGNDTHHVWDLMQSEPVTLGMVVDHYRIFFGTHRGMRIRLPGFLLDLAAKLGDAVALLRWTPPVRSTAIAELRRGVTGDPVPWIAATGIAPQTLAQMVNRRSATIQDKWFARLFLLKPMIFVSLVLFWIVSGLIALFVSYDAAAGILSAHHFPPALVGPITVGTSLMDMATGVLIAFRRTSAAGLIWGILASLGYMFGAALLTPDLWIEPLGALVKTGPAIILMLVALAMLDNR